jgi:asparagine synthase (glutamine-hydrolysing)
MCGIAGIITDNADTYQKNIQLMVDTLHHRGPDDSGTFYFKNCALGHTRLSIVDLKSGLQPMHSAFSTKCIVFNGEIYGYHEIRDRLNGYPFVTTSDTEVILALYEKEGIKCLDHLPGMFAFGIWDELEQTLFAARDRFGEKPFYYAWGKNGEFIFASEIKAILATGLISPVLSKSALYHYMQFLYIHPYQTVYENVFTLPPAHYLLLKEEKITIQRYWRFPEVNDSITIQEAVEQFRNLFERAIKNQLVADVPVGAFLSGGVDSSSVVAVATKFVEKFQTFTFGFEDAASEFPYSKEIAEKYRTFHRELTAEDIDIGKLLVKMAEIYDEPLADSSNIPTYLLAQLSREHLKVILTGEGGDELLGGYAWWYYPLLGIGNPRCESRIKLPFLYVITIILFCLHSNSTDRWKKKIDLILKANLFDSVKEAYSKKGQFFSEKELNKLFLNSQVPEKITIPQYWKVTNTVNDALMMDLENYMPGDILVKSDRASMAHGVEFRSPFLDVDFASFCISLPSRLKITKDEDKIILRRAYEKLWTEKIQKRPKQGFAAPVDKWLQKKSVEGLKEKYLKDPKLKLFQLFSFDQVKRIALKNTYQTWIILVLSIWLEHHEFIMNTLQ